MLRPLQGCAGAAVDDNPELRNELLGGPIRPDESDEDRATRVGMLTVMPGMLGSTPFGSAGVRGPGVYRRVGHVLVHPRDCPAFYPPAIFKEDPAAFEPPPAPSYFFRGGPINGDIKSWGLYYDDYTSGKAITARQYAFNTMKLYTRPPDAGVYTPLWQFASALEARKRKAMEQRRAHVANLQYVLELKLMLLHEGLFGRVTRRIEVPASMELYDLHFRVLRPCMGWSKEDESAYILLSSEIDRHSSVELAVLISCAKSDHSGPGRGGRYSLWAARLLSSSSYE